QFEAAIGTPIDAPAGIEVAQGVEAGVLRPPLPGDYAGSNLRRQEGVAHQGYVMRRPAGAGAEHELAGGAGQLPFAEGGHHHPADGNHARPGTGLRPANGAVAIGTLADTQLATFEIDIFPLKPS